MNGPTGGSNLGPVEPNVQFHLDNVDKILVELVHFAARSENLVVSVNQVDYKAALKELADRLYKMENKWRKIYPRWVTDPVSRGLPKPQDPP